ncbi:MAG: PAS domain S-box protein [Calditrichaeota bacterium]|nr:PAS domain S-box protein [Calditrichota bacterium]
MSIKTNSNSEEKISFSISLQNFFHIFIPLFFLMLVIFAFVYWSNIKAEMIVLKKQEASTTNLQYRQLNSEINSLFKQLQIFMDDSFIEYFLSDQNINLQQDLLHLSKANTNYDQIRLLDIHGKESLRINFNNGKPFIVPKDQLQDKKDRFYFKILSELGSNYIYVSVLDLNIENNQIEKPLKPVIRFGKAYFNNQSDRIGYFILNYSAKKILDQFSETGITSIGNHMLVNQNGYWLRSDTPENDWSFITADPDVSFKNKFRFEWDKINKEDAGQFETNNGLFTFKTVHLFESDNYNSISFYRDEYYWKIVSFIPRHMLAHIRKGVLESFAPLLIFLSAVICIGSWLLAWLQLQKKSRDVQLKKLSLAVQQSPVTVVITNTKGNIEYANQTFEKSTGYKLSEVMGENPRILKSGTMPESYYKELWDTISVGNIWKGEFHNKKKSGELFWEATTISPIRNKKDQITHFLAVKEDITVRKQMEEELRRANDELENKVEQRTAQLQEINASLELEIKKHKSTEKKLKEKQEALRRSNKDLEEFAYIASHDLNEPLRKISSFIKLFELNMKDKMDDDAKNYMNFILSGTERMRNLITELLRYSRVNIKDKKLKTISTDFTVSNALSNLELMVFESKAEIIKGTLPKVKGDETQLLQLFQNLIGNALKYRNSAPPRIEIGANEEKDNWLFYVKDNGIGLDPQYAEKIFLIFQRLHTRNEYSGTGIGLAICKKIVEQHGGKIWVESQKGEGATFFFTLKK